jgi:hypothetical protein
MGRKRSKDETKRNSKHLKVPTEQSKKAKVSNYARELEATALRTEETTKKPQRGRDEAELHQEESVEKSIATIELLSADAWNRVSQGLDRPENLISRESGLELLKPTSYLSLGKRRIPKTSSINNIWSSLTDSESRFVAHVVLFGVQWRVEGSVTQCECTEKDDGSKVFKFELCDYLVLREPRCKARENTSRMTWKRCSPSNLGLESASSLRVLLCYSSSLPSAILKKQKKSGSKQVSK